MELRRKRHKAVRCDVLCVIGLYAVFAVELQLSVQLKFQLCKELDLKVERIET